MKISLPYHFNRRSYQRAMWDDMVHFTDNGKVVWKKKRGCCVWHRRSGKDKNAINFMATIAYYDRKGTYAYFFPTYAQGKKILWDGMGKDGFRFLDHFPKQLVYSYNETEMQIVLCDRDEMKKGKRAPGSVVQILGTDNIDRIVGMNIIGAAFSEYSLQSPRAWKYVQPMLSENGGWAIFLYTPRGENHGYKLYKDSALKHPDRWHVSLLTVDDTIRDAEGEDGSRVVSQEQIDADVADGMDEDTVQQEYYCAFSGFVRGSYFGSLIAKAKDEGRIVRVPWIPTLAVATSWDIGVHDQTAIWFWQRVGEKVHLIDYYEDETKGLPHYAKFLHDKPYIFEYHAVPHDAAVTEWGSGIQRKRAMENLGIKPVRVQPKARINEQIDHARTVIPVALFDERLCEDGIAALMQFHRDYDEDKDVYGKNPEHDWSSHGASSFMTGSMAWKPGRALIGRQGIPSYSSNSHFNVFGGQEHG
jgi:phage terminase large subunit